MAKDVKCKVCTCKYYAQGDLCEASVIEVNADKKQCGCSSETNCKTFQPK